MSDEYYKHLSQEIYQLEKRSLKKNEELKMYFKEEKIELFQA